MKVDFRIAAFTSGFQAAFARARLTRRQLGAVRFSLGLDDAQASMSVPSTEKCSSDNSGATALSDRIAARNLRAMSVVKSRSRFFVKTVGTQTGSSTPSPTNHRNSRLYCICSINCRSDRIVNKIWISTARKSRSGAIEGRPSAA